MATQNVYSLRIFGHASLTSAGGRVGPVVPDGLVYVLRDIDVYELTGAGGTLMNVYNQLEGLLVEWVGGTTAEQRAFAWRGRQVYAPGEQVGFNVVAGTWAIAASGYQLTLP
jgi:hypothetical protein